MGCGGSSDKGQFFDHSISVGVPSQWDGMTEAAILHCLFSFIMSPDMFALAALAGQTKGATVTDLKVSPVAGGVVCNYKIMHPGQLVPKKVSVLHEFSRVHNRLLSTTYYVELEEYVPYPSAIKARAMISCMSEFCVKMLPDAMLGISLTVFPIEVHSRMPGIGMMIKTFKPLIRSAMKRTMDAVEDTFAQKPGMPAPIEIDDMLVLPVATLGLPVAHGAIAPPVPEADVLGAKALMIKADNPI